MKVLPIIYLFYMFVSMYFLFFFLLLYFKNKKNIFECPTTQKQYSLSIVIPCWNEEKTIRGTIEALLNSDYKGLKKIIVVDDCSTDNSYSIIKEMAGKYKKIIAVQTPKQTGNAGGAKSYGAKFVDTDLIGFTDSDSYHAKDAINKLVGFFDDEKVGAATGAFTPRNTNGFLEKMQVIEYNVIAFTRKLLGFVDGIYVTPGPLAIYRKKAFDEIGGFDPANMTEDIEIAWHLISAGYKIKMCLSSSATTTVPTKMKAWYRQRRRWCVGGMQCIVKYKKDFLKKGMLGMFVIPFFTFQFFLGLLGLSVFVYVFIRNIISKYLLVTYSIPAEVPLLTMEDFFITPSFLNYLGIILFVAGIAFTLLILGIMRETILKKQSLFNIFLFSLVYLSIYPFITISSIYNYFKRDKRWR